MDVSIDSTILDQLNTTEARALHEITDRLSSCGVGKIVNLPQIIVVGEQSAGKSSVLEAISHVRFPVKGDLCTRFATELVLRQARETRVDVGVKFADKSRPSQAFQRTGFSENDLPGIIREAKECMGISGTGRDFSKDVLRLEIEGPNMYPLTLVDLPGLFHVDTADQSMRGKETVDQLVESYMKQKNSIILVVITASNQLANHVALRKVKEHDPQRERTLGVITKPDLTRAGYSDERTYIQVAKNQESANKLRLGWHVLRNRAEDEESLESRDNNEERFFQSTAWGAIPREDRGVVSLRKKLSRVLFDHIRNNMHSVVADIEGKLRERQEELDRLGKPRSSYEDMRSFLLTIAGDFQRLARDGIHGRYSDAFFGDLDDEDHKLRAQLRNFNRVFDHVLSTKGSRQAIVANEDEDPECKSPPEYLESFLKTYPYDFPDPAVITVEDLNSQLQQQAASNQGREFPGSPNKDLVIQLFQKQASPWKSIAEFHVSQVTLVTKAFVDQLFRHVIGPPDTSRATEAILCACVDPFFEQKEKVLREKLEELLRPYNQGYALPLDADFHRTMSQRSMRRLTDRFMEALQDENPEVFEDAPRKRLTHRMVSEAISNTDDFDGGEFGTDKVIDMMEAYYEMSRRTFTDNVINLAIESCLICDIPDILTPTKVDRMSKEALGELAAESEDAQSRREHLQEEVEILRQGLEQCRRYKPRTVTVLSSARQSQSPSVAANRSTTRRPSPSPTPVAASSSSSTAPPSGLFSSGSSQTVRNSTASSSQGSSSVPLVFGSVSTPAASKVTGPAPAGGGDVFAHLSKTNSSGGLFGSSSAAEQREKSPPRASAFAFSSTPIRFGPSGGLFGSQGKSSASPGDAGKPSFAKFGNSGQTFGGLATASASSGEATTKTTRPS
ncbi:Interferon-induced GTP-binding protein Mx3 [Tolypocladium ophioglossoides CBS 100239]|uniref:Interferon-induced GTP-binding protein Mx3 n=1 Tax=Tolypocladium ophioglossoides (strain CBS 100239) TaxID=1163406 RepID=A0A0L0NHV6_TOLOC|nr:Interferon-induced GTP-binding protein Mx3 [Tolypocladium ophioglossoides CBS 100239]